MFAASTFSPQNWKYINSVFNTWKGIMTPINKFSEMVPGEVFKLNPVSERPGGWKLFKIAWPPEDFVGNLNKGEHFLLVDKASDMTSISLKILTPTHLGWLFFLKMDFFPFQKVVYELI